MHRSKRILLTLGLIVVAVIISVGVYIALSMAATGP